jgi:hypothetical protein
MKHVNAMEAGHCYGPFDSEVGGYPLLANGIFEYLIASL